MRILTEVRECGKLCVGPLQGTGTEEILLAPRLPEEAGVPKKFCSTVISLALFSCHVMQQKHSDRHEICFGTIVGSKERRGLVVHLVRRLLISDQLLFFNRFA